MIKNNHSVTTQHQYKWASTVGFRAIKTDTFRRNEKNNCILISMNFFTQRTLSVLKFRAQPRNTIFLPPSFYDIEMTKYNLQG